MKRSQAASASGGKKIRSLKGAVAAPSWAGGAAPVAKKVRSLKGAVAAPSWAGGGGSASAATPAAQAAAAAAALAASAQKAAAQAAAARGGSHNLPPAAHAAPAPAATTFNFGGGGSGSGSGSGSGGNSVVSTGAAKSAASVVGGSVDTHAPGHLSGGGAVYKAFDCMLNQTDLRHNANKFIKAQLVQHGGGVSLWKRWGRVGDVGQSQEVPFDDPSDAVAAFEKYFRDKTKNSWAARGRFQKVDGKYDLIEIEADAAVAAAVLGAAGAAAAAGPVAPCT